MAMSTDADEKREGSTSAQNVDTNHRPISVERIPPEPARERDMVSNPTHALDLLLEIHVARLIISLIYGPSRSGSCGSPLHPLCLLLFSQK